MNNSTPSTESDRVVPVLLVLFIGSGCSALIYEIVWFELLRQVVGASSISLAIVLTSFMGGLFLGSWGFPRWVSLQRHPLKVYALLELAIGVIGMLMLVVLPLVGFLYVSAVGYGPTAILLRASVCLICLLPPTIMMGATLPAVARWMTTTRVGISRMGFLYTANIVGAVGGTLLAGFYLLPQYDMLLATQVAAAINALVAILAALLAVRVPFRAAARPNAPDQGGEPAFTPQVRPWVVHVVIGFSGLTALGAQVVWTRLASLLFGATVYTFTIILAVFLTGLGIGSSIGAYIARVSSRPATVLGWSQLALVGAIPLAALLINQVLPFWTLERGLLQQDGVRFGFDLLRGSVAMLPATVLWGASFPLALAAAARDDVEPAYLVGDVYAANTLGAIVGAMAFGMVMIPWVGTQHSQQVITVLAGIAALLIFVTITPAGAAKPAVRTRVIAARAGLVAIVAVAASAVSPTEPRLIGFGHEIAKWAWDHVYEYTGEGRSSSVALSTAAGYRVLHVSGKVVTSTDPRDMRITRMLGHLPALLHPDPKSVLIVGFGAGVTAGSFVRYPGIERIVICEIEPLVTRISGQYFVDGNYDVLNDPRTEVIYDDARHFIATTDESFDIITSDPIHPWLRGSATLYSSEYYELVKAHLNPGGLVTQWVPMYQSTEEVVKSEIGTFFEAFPDATVWHSNIQGEGYDLVLLGQEGPLEIDVVAVRERFDQNELVENSLVQVGFDSLDRILTAYTAQKSDLEAWLRDAQINHDRSLRLQYLAGRFVHVDDAPGIYKSLARYRRYPNGIFIAPAEEEADLRRFFDGGRIDLSVPNR